MTIQNKDIIDLFIQVILTETNESAVRARPWVCCWRNAWAFLFA